MKELEILAFFKFGIWNFKKLEFSNSVPQSQIYSA